MKTGVHLDPIHTVHLPQVEAPHSLSFRLNLPLEGEEEEGGDKKGVRPITPNQRMLSRGSPGKAACQACNEVPGIEVPAPCPCKGVPLSTYFGLSW